MCCSRDRILLTFQTESSSGVFWEGGHHEPLIARAAKCVLMTTGGVGTAAPASGTWHLVDLLKFAVKWVFRWQRWRFALCSSFQSFRLPHVSVWPLPASPGLSLGRRAVGSPCTPPATPSAQAQLTGCLQPTSGIQGAPSRRVTGHFHLSAAKPGLCHGPSGGGRPLYLSEPELPGSPKGPAALPAT